MVITQIWACPGRAWNGN